MDGPKRTRVLIVDDHPLVLKALRRALAAHYGVYPAGSVDEALRIASETDLDIVVTDLELGDPDERDGIWLLDQLRARWGLDGLVLTGACEHRDGAFVLRKPVLPSTLRAAIDGLLPDHGAGTAQEDTVAADGP